MKRTVLNLIVLAWLLLLPSAGLACTCNLDIPLLRKPEDQQIRVARKRAKALFLGKVVDIRIDEKTQTYQAKFKVQNVWKNVDSDEVIVRGTTMCCICEYTFKVGERYVVYANDYDRATGEYDTSSCTRTTLLANAQKDLKTLGKGKVRDRGHN